MGLQYRHTDCAVDWEARRGRSVKNEGRRKEGNGGSAKVTSGKARGRTGWRGWENVEREHTSVMGSK